MSINSDLIKATTLSGFSSLVKELDGNPEALLEKVGINPLLLETHDSYISFKTCCRLLELAAQITRTPEFGLLLGKKQNLSTLGPIGLALQQSQSYAEAMDLFQRYYRTHNQCATISMSSNRGIIQLTHTTNIHERYPHSQAKFKSICIATNILRLFHGKDWEPVEIWFDFSLIGNKRTVEKILGARVIFDQPESSILYSERPFDQLFFDPDKNPNLRQIIHHYLETKAGKIDQDLPSQVTDLIKTTLGTGVCTKENIAKILSLNPRTLQRKLAVENTDFKSLLNDVRKKSAQHYLLSTKQSITEISEILGYQDLSSFSRAFKCWFGTSPQIWQKNSKELLPYK